jgi:integrase
LERTLARAAKGDNGNHYKNRAGKNMAITRVEYDYNKPGTRWDPKVKKHIGYKVNVRVGGRRYRTGGFATREKAEDYIEDLRTAHKNHKAGIAPKADKIPTVKELLDKRLSLITKEKSKKRAKRIFAEFQRIAGPIRLDAVRPAHFQLYINSRKNVKLETIDREMSEISAAFNSALEMFPVELDGFEPARVKRPKYKKGNGRQRVITEMERNAIYSHILNDRLPREHDKRKKARPAVAAAFDLAWLLGLRFGEIKKLLKSDYKGKTLRVVRWKTGVVSMIKPLPDFIQKLLDENCVRSQTEHIFDFSCSDHTITEILKDACTNAGITYGIGEIDGVTFHSTRHSFTTRLVRVTDLATAQSFTGHSTKEMLGYYAHASEDSQALAMHRLYGQTADIEKLYNAVKDGMSLDDFKREIDALKLA